MNRMVPFTAITGKIIRIQGHNVLLDRDLAELYGIETRVLTQAVRRNLKRFPADFMFILENQEVNLLMSQNVISKTSGRGGTRKPPMAFTESGWSDGRGTEARRACCGGGSERAAVGDG